MDRITKEHKNNCDEIAKEHKTIEFYFRLSEIERKHLTSFCLNINKKIMELLLLECLGSKCGTYVASYLFLLSFTLTSHCQFTVSFFVPPYDLIPHILFSLLFVIILLFILPWKVIACKFTVAFFVQLCDLTQTVYLLNLARDGEQ